MIALLDILKREKGIVDKINNIDDSIDILSKERKAIEEMDIRCEERTRDLIRLNDQIAYFRSEKFDLMERLIDVQAQIKEYFTAIKFDYNTEI